MATIRDEVADSLQSRSIATLPQELLLEIFEWLLPGKHYELEHADLQNVGLTCKALVAPATELFFRHYELFLYPDHFYPFALSTSYDIFEATPRIAGHVRSVSVAVVSQTLHSSYQSLIENDQTNEEADGFILRQATERLEEVSMSVSSALVEALKQFYRTRLRSRTFVDRYSLPDPQAVGAKIRTCLNIFHNVRRIEFYAVNRDRSPLYLEMEDFWAEQGIPENTSHALYPLFFTPTQGSWETRVVLASLVSVPASVESLEVFMHTVNRGVALSELQDILHVRSQLRTQLRSLEVNVSAPDVTEMDDHDAGLRVSDWATFLCGFDALTAISLIGSTLGFYANHPEITYAGPDVCLPFLRNARLPRLRRMTLKNWSMHASSLRELDVAFPMLQQLFVDAIAIMSRGHRMENLTWYDVAETIGIYYQGNCALRFGPGLCVEWDGDFDDSKVFHEPGEPPRSHQLKPSALDILEVVSQLPTRDEGLYQAYFDLIKHTLPEFIDEYGIAVDTPGMYHTYPCPRDM